MKPGLADVLLLAGTALITAAAWLVSPILALFTLGGSLTGAGGWVAKRER